VSADNGIYVLKTPTENGEEEFRVIHAQAIENLWDENEEGNPEQVISYYGKARVFHNKEDASKEIKHLYDEIMSNPFCPILEYGICDISLPHPFSYYREKAISEEKQIRDLGF